MAEQPFNQPKSVAFAVPEWLARYTAQSTPLPTDEDKMQFVLGAARRNIAEGTGGPFAAAVFECNSGRLVSLGVNLVTSSGLSVLHAEVVAVSLAQQKLGHYDLGSAQFPAHELVTSTEPCAMCYGAVPWSGVKRLVTGARDQDARLIGFDEGPKLTEWDEALRERGIEVVTDVCREQAAQVLKDYMAAGGHIYNSREPR